MTCSAVWLTLLVGLGAPDIVQECQGCHTEARTAPQERFASGLGRWRDQQCFGCHEELNSIATELASGRKDRRYFAAPVREERLRQLSHTPLSYMTAPVALQAALPAPPRIALSRLAAFLRRPTPLAPREGSRAPSMMAYPRLETDDLRAVARLFRLPLAEEMAAGNASIDAGAVFASRCAACHDGAFPVSGRSAAALSLYSAAWIHAYANGLDATRAVTRRMPVVPISKSEAEALYRYFGVKRREVERAVDAAVADVAFPPAGSLPRVPRALVDYIWGPFLRDATCVHCHVTSTRAARAFRADAAGLKDYLAQRSGEAFWRRLEIRAVEAQHGMGAAEPGMPMAGAPLPTELRTLIASWVGEGCPTPEGSRACAAPPEPEQH